MIEADNQCTKTSPRSGDRCTMAPGHFGSHQVGGPYNTTERFVTKCEGECDFHYNSRAGDEWEQCIHCGDKRNNENNKNPEADAFWKERIRDAGWRTG